MFIVLRGKLKLVFGRAAKEKAKRRLRCRVPREGNGRGAVLLPGRGVKYLEREGTNNFVRGG